MYTRWKRKKKSHSPIHETRFPAFHATVFPLSSLPKPEPSSLLVDASFKFLSHETSERDRFANELRSRTSDFGIEPPVSSFGPWSRMPRYCFHPVGISSLVGWRRARIWSVTSFRDCVVYTYAKARLRLLLFYAVGEAPPPSSFCVSRRFDEKRERKEDKREKKAAKGGEKGKKMTARVFGMAPCETIRSRVLGHSSSSSSSSCGITCPSGRLSRKLKDCTSVAHIPTWYTGCFFQFLTLFLFFFNF